jgi:maltose O-acetyltransferase
MGIAYRLNSLLFHVARSLPGSARSSLGCRIRVALLRRLAGSAGRDINVLAGAHIGNPANLTIGDNSAVGLGCYLSCLAPVRIGDRVLMGPEVMVYTSHHVWSAAERSYFRQGETLAPVVIGDDAWLGARAIILPGVTIGKGCTVAAGAVVTKSTADYTTVAGVPAVPIHTKPIL